MNAKHNPGIWQDKEQFPFMVETGNRSGNDYEVFYITAFMQCTCKSINCQHVQAVRDMLNTESVSYEEANAAAINEAEMWGEAGRPRRVL